MATVIPDEAHQSVVSVSYSWWRIALIGGAIGVLYWGVTALVSNLIINPLFCGSSVNAAACSNSIGLSGNIASLGTVYSAGNITINNMADSGTLNINKIRTKKTIK